MLLNSNAAAADDASDTILMTLHARLVDNILSFSSAAFAVCSNKSFAAFVKAENMRICHGCGSARFA